MKGGNFVIRVYGIYLHPEKGLLVSDEHIYGRNVTKFPGGGLHFGEGTIECLKREMMEETGCEFNIGKHFYTTDFFVESAFDPAKQVVSIYYFMNPKQNFSVEIKNKKFDFSKVEHGVQVFRFIPVEKIAADEFTLTIDCFAGGLLREYLKQI
jgi:ADP-ribose pyrophosphatase YjhB (NUDIX family)